MGNKYLAPIAIHPGEHIKEIIESLEMNQNEFADKLGISAKCLSEIIDEKAGITVDMADKLSKMFGNSVLYWINLQTNYEETLIRIKEQSIY